MNLNNYTTKSQETIKMAQEIAQGFGHNQIENEHIFKALTRVDENVLPFLLKKLYAKFISFWLDKLEFISFDLRLG